MRAEREGMGVREGLSCHLWRGKDRVCPPSVSVRQVGSGWALRVSTLF